MHSTAFNLSTTCEVGISTHFTEETQAKHDRKYARSHSPKSLSGQRHMGAQGCKTAKIRHHTHTTGNTCL